MKTKALRLELYQPFAHYRDQKVMQDDYVPTLMLPTKTAIAGMITYLCDRRLESKFKIGALGSFKCKSKEFTRGENLDFWKQYGSLKSKKEQGALLSGTYYDYYKDNVAGNSIVNYEVLNDVKLTIYFATEDEKEFDFVKEKLSKPQKYMCLGRKEDFIVPVCKGTMLKQVEIEENFMVSSIPEAIKNKIKLKNTYVNVDLFDSKYDGILNQGILHALPQEYSSLTADKVERKMKFAHYVYVKEDGYYPVGLAVNIWREENGMEVFTWL